MIRLLGKIPRDFCLAYSGGQDSGVALNFLLNGRHKPHVIHFHHGTNHSDDAEWIVKRECERYRSEFNIDFELWAVIATGACSAINHRMASI